MAASLTDAHHALIRLLAALAVDRWCAEQEEEKKSKEEESIAWDRRDGCER